MKHTEGTLRWIAAALVFVYGCGSADADPPPDYDFQFQTIGAPGNAPAIVTQGGEPVEWGAVSYEYRMSRLEVTNSQWLEFVNAYWPYAQMARDDLRLTGIGVVCDNPFGPGDPLYRVRTGRADWPADMSWRVAAVFCNWLTNDKRSDRAAFESGAYDISTFTANPGGVNDQLVHSPTATFWMPSLDEWIKAVYYDPNRFGNGQGGYWQFPNSTDEPLVNGPPGIGQTNAGLPPSLGAPVGQYPESLTPWGLLDASGGESEWLEGSDDPNRIIRYAAGTNFADVAYSATDRLGVFLRGDSFDGHRGLRIASAVSVPSPAVGHWLVVGFLWVGRRHRGACCRASR